MTFRPRNMERLGNQISVQIPLDEQGFMGRECPVDKCLGYFKVKPGTGLAGADLPCHCPYCGHSGGNDTFYTPEQIEYAKSIALRQVSEALRKDLKQLEFDHKPKGAFGIGISMKLKPGAPIRIRQYREKQLETHVTCDSCTLQYAVYGLFGFCPDCRDHNSFQILGRNLRLVEKQLSLAEGLEDAELRRHLIEDALENCVSAFDGFGREACRVYAGRSAEPEKAANLSFQNLARADERVEELFGTKFSANISPETWKTAETGFMRRHVISHRAGVVDQAYLDQTSDPDAVIGRRINVSADAVRAVAAAVLEIGSEVIRITSGRVKA